MAFALVFEDRACGVGTAATRASMDVTTTKDLILTILCGVGNVVEVIVFWYHKNLSLVDVLSSKYSEGALQFLYIPVNIAPHYQRNIQVVAQHSSGWVNRLKHQRHKAACMAAARKISK